MQPRQCSFKIFPTHFKFRACWKNNETHAHEIKDAKMHVEGNCKTVTDFLTSIVINFKA